MALTNLNNSDTEIDHSKITGITPIKKMYNKNIWYFKVLINRRWFALQYTDEIKATNVHGALVNGYGIGQAKIGSTFIVK